MVGVTRLIPMVWLALALAAGALPGGYLQLTRNWLFDLYQRAVPAERASGTITIIDIDEASLARVGQWPWPRTALARLIDAARPARAIGIDLIMAEQDRASPEVWAAGRRDLPEEVGRMLETLPATDEILARSIAQAPVVLPVAIQLLPPSFAGETRSAVPLSPIVISGPETDGAKPLGDMPAAGAIVPPLAMLAKAARGIGIISVPSEFDAVLRRVPLMFNIGGTPVASFAAEVLRVATRSGPISLPFNHSGIAGVGIGGLSVRTDQIGRVWPRYGRKVPATDVPAWRVLEGSADPALFRDRIVLIGATAAGLQDVIVTPLGQTMSGIGGHAQVIASILAHDTLWRPPHMLLAELLLTLLGGIAAQLLAPRLGVGLYGGLVVGTMVLLIGTSALLFGTTGLLLDWTFPLIAIAGTALLAMALHVRREIMQRRQRERELADSLMIVEAANRAKTELLANVSHELRTPLSAVIGFSDMMSRQIMGPLSPVYADYANDINKSGRHLLAVIDDILDVSVLELGGAQMRQERVSPATAIEDCRRMATPRAQHRGVTLRAESDPGLPELRADFRMMKQMVLNLVSNAIKFAPRGTEIVIRSILREGWLCIGVADRGPGIAPADLAKVTERFARMRSAGLAREPGIGIGLALTKSMVELHGGRLELESEVGQGTTAWLRFPPTAILQKEEK